MADDWLEVPDERIDAQQLVRRVRERLSECSSTISRDGEDPVAVAQAIWKEVVRETMEASGGAWQDLDEDACDIVPRSYVIDWRMPILGPLHALVRRIIHAEVRRYLLPALEKQSHLNRQMWLALRDLAQENARLRREVEGREHDEG